MRFLSVIAVVALLAPIAQPASADMKDDCAQNRNPNLRIDGCTAVIRYGDFSGWNLAISYSNRGNAHYKLGEYRRAIEDYDQTLRIDPGHANARANRAMAYNK